MAVLMPITSLAMLTSGPPELPGLMAASVAMVAFWVAYYCTQLKTRPLVQTNDPHVAEILEPEHANA